MGKAFAFVLMLAILTMITDISGLVWSGAKDPPSDSFAAFTTPPPDLVASTAENGYFILVGLAAGPNADPVKTGYDIWREAENGRGHYYYDYAKEGRTELRIPPDLAHTVQAWKIEDLAAAPEQFREALKTFESGFQILLDRYAQWLEMPFDDEGYGHTGSPRLTEIFLAHRAYLAAGFIRARTEGIDRLATDLPTWRTVLERAKTPAVKLVAAAAVGDDARILSALLSRKPDAATTKRLADLAQPLTEKERSLRWPLQHEFAAGLSRFKSVPLAQAPGPRRQSEEHERWVTDMTGLSPDSFARIELPLPTNPILLALAKKQRTLNLYADYYEHLVKAFGTTPITLPTLHEFAKQGPRSLLDPLLNPVDNIFVSAPEPALAPILGYLRETDARLRLAGLQAFLLDTPREQPMAAAIGKAGPDYYDPFTGIPMVWNASQGTIYSVGRDGRDDGGERSFDVVVKLDEAPLPNAPAKPAKPAKRGAAPAVKPTPAAKAPAA